MTARTLIFVGLTGVGLAILRLTGDHPVVSGLGQPSRFLVQLAVFLGWFGTLAAVDWRLGRGAK